jgi:hypothetical protein
MKQERKVDPFQLLGVNNIKNKIKILEGPLNFSGWNQTCPKSLKGMT